MPIVIVGGGVAGLSAGWRLDAHGMRDWMLLELGDRAGGNARSGRGEHGVFPWGAHYLPVPDARAEHVRTLMRDLGVLYANGEWDERMLCHAPQERLFQNGRWHEGLEPFDALSRAGRTQFDQWSELVAEARASGAFAVPVASAPAGASAAARWRHLDGETAHAWLTRLGFSDPALRWWVEYGTRDDYAASLDNASAWAALHYFASRPHDEVGPLTWPEGNDWIAQRLIARAGTRVRTHAPVVRLERVGTRWHVDTPALRVIADAVVWAAPLFVLPRVLAGATAPPVTTTYAPWVVANVTLREPPVERYAPTAWDNVIYASDSLGYVDAGHQLLSTRPPERVWTWYHAAVDSDAAAARRTLTTTTWPQWRDRIVRDLERAHPDIRPLVTRVDVRLWGHAMARPTPGLLARREALARWQPAPRLTVAHSDVSGVSLFEEAQWQGVRGADRALRWIAR